MEAMFGKNLEMSLRLLKAAEDTLPLDATGRHFWTHPEGPLRSSSCGVSGSEDVGQVDKGGPLKIHFRCSKSKHL